MPHVLEQWEKARILNGLHDGCWKARVTAIHSCVTFKLTEMLEDIIWLVKNDHDYDVREVAVKAIGKIGSSNEIDLLEQISKTDSDSDVRRAAKKSIQLLKEKFPQTAE